MCTPTKWNRAPRGQLRHCNIHYPFVRPFEFIIRALPEPKCARRSTDLIFMLEKKCAQRSTRFTEFFSTLWKRMILGWFRIILVDAGWFFCSSRGDVSLLFSLFFSWSRFFLAFLISLLVCLLFFWCGCCIVVLLLDAFLLSCLAHLAFLSCFWCVGSSSWLFVSSSRFFCMVGMFLLVCLVFVSHVWYIVCVV